MRKFGKESTAPAEGVDRESGKGWLQNHCALAVCIVAILAFVLRFVFAYGVSSSGGFALSGGSDAQYHLHVVESILNGSFVFGADAAVNYPVGGLNVNPPLYDFIAAGLGAVTSASTALAVLAPIFGALTCFPVYLVGKEMKDAKTGLVAALIYGLMALPIVSSVLSNGTEYAFAAFLFAFFTWSYIKVARDISNGELVIKNVAISGILLGLIALSWNGFRAILVMLIVIMVVQLVLDRFNSKDFKVPLYAYSIMMLIGVAMAAVYYIPAGLWDAVFSGPVLITVIAVVFGFIFMALKNTPWIFTIPGLIIAFAAIAVILFFVAPDYCTALIFGNSAFTNPIMEQLASTGVSISKMSSYYGWLLMWMPITLGVYEFYKYARYDRSHVQLAKTMWLVVLWIFAWSSYGAAAAFGIVFAVSSAIVIVEVLTRADLRTYFASMRQAGFPGFLRKMIKPLPFLSILIAVFLVAAPGIIYAVDAGISSNETYGYPFYGNTTYTIETGDTYPFHYVVENLGDKDSAVVTWVDVSTDFAAGGYNTVNDRYASGASAAAQIYLASGADGATAAQIVRVMMSSNDDFSPAFEGYSEVYNEIKGYIADPASAKAYLLNNEKFQNVSADVTDENAVYFACIDRMTTEMTSGSIFWAYDGVCDISGKVIGNYIVDGSMVPLMYGDGNSLSTMSYFAGYNIDGNGAATQFFSYITYYSSYYPAIGTDALYETFLWKALIGPSPSEAGYTNSYNYLLDLISSDGSVKAMPGYGLAGYEVDFDSWMIRYNADPKATTSSDGWTYMSYSDAMAKQKAEGGVVNYLSSIVALKYVGATTTLTSTVVNDDLDGEPVEGITIQVKYFDQNYGADVVFSETKTNRNGEFSVLVPGNNLYNIDVLSDGVRLFTDIRDEEPIVVYPAMFMGELSTGDAQDYMYVLKKDGKSYFIQTKDGYINSADAVDEDGQLVSLVPGKYSYELRDATATTVVSGSVTLYNGLNTGLLVTPTSYKITATVKDFFGQTCNGGILVATNSTTGDEYRAAVENGQAVVKVPSGTYTVSLEDGYMSANTTSLSVTTNRTVDITAYSVKYVEILGGGETSLVAYGGDVSTIAFEGFIAIPQSIGATLTNFTVYGVDSERVYLGVYTEGDSVELQSGDVCKVTGSIGTAGNVTFINADGAVVTTTAASDGAFTAYLIAGHYVVSANNGTDKAYFGTVDVEGNKNLETLTLSDARKVTETYQYSSATSKSNISLPFAAMTIQFTLNDVVYEIPAVSSTSGKAEFIIPDAATNIKVEINGGYIDNEAFTYGSAEDKQLLVSIDDGSSDVSQSKSIPKDNMDKMNIVPEYTAVLIPYGGTTEIQITAGEAKELSPGQYTAKINATTGYYFNGTVYIYPGSPEISGFNVIEVFGIEITKGANDTITITGEKSHNNYNGDDVYYFEYDCMYTIKSYNSETENVRYANVYRAEPEVGGAIDMTTSSKMKITGYVGAVADGTISAKFMDNGEVTVETDVDNGEFEFELPSGIASVEFSVAVSQTISSQTYTYVGYAYVNAPTDGTIVNIAVQSDIIEEKYTADLDAYIASAVFEEGDVTIGLKVFNNTDADRNYVITAGPAWTMNELVTVTIAANSSQTLTLEGKYETNGSGIGTNGMTVIISDFNGTATKTVPVVDGDVTGAYSSIVLKKGENKDRISGNEYQYALTFQNSNGMDKVNIQVDDIYGFDIKLMNADGSVIKDNGADMIVSAQSTTVIFVKIMAQLDEMTTIPSIHVVTSVGSEDLSPSTMEIHVDSVSVSGDSAVSQKSGIPMGLWFIFALSIILLILIIWMGSKRGVFSRK